KKAVDPRPSGAAAEAGAPGQRALVAGQARARAVAAVGDKTNGLAENQINGRRALKQQCFAFDIFWRIVMSLRIRRFAFLIWWLILAIIIPLAACNKAVQPSYAVYASPDEAGSALLDAAKSGDQARTVAIFGPESRDIIYSGDAVQDKKLVDAFVAAYGVMHRWRKMADGTQMLLVGADNFVFPIPLKKNEAGKWFFDIAAGKDEILARRIGRN